MELTKLPGVNVGLLIRAPAHAVYEALVDPSITTRFWYTHSSGRMDAGADLTWEWRMYGASSHIHVLETEPDQLVRFNWDGYDPVHPTTVEFKITPYEGKSAYLRVTEIGFTGDADTAVKRAMDSTAGFTFMICGLKAVLEKGVELGIVGDVFPPNLKE
ncbi:activator of Hsp90 ATPase 1 family protein [Thozetella sp. PMI_491]|nr:activator of Hsp90 ATPase 1 family protein [Thozetella sp. PMI_491]